MKKETTTVSIQVSHNKPKVNFINVSVPKSFLWSTSLSESVKSGRLVRELNSILPNFDFVIHSSDDDCSIEVGCPKNVVLWRVVQAVETAIRKQIFGSLVRR